MHISFTSISLSSNWRLLILGRIAGLKGVGRHLLSEPACIRSQFDIHRPTSLKSMNSSKVSLARYGSVSSEVSARQMQGLSVPEEMRNWFELKTPVSVHHSTITSSESSGGMSGCHNILDLEHMGATNWQNEQALNRSLPNVPRLQLSGPSYPAEHNVFNSWSKGILEHCWHR